MKKIHLIGNSHIDAVWLWRWQEGYHEVKATFRSALDRMKEFDHYVFTSACSVYHQWIEQSDPKMFEEIKARVAEGRWCIVGGWYLQPDCNIPCGESFARQALLGQRYFQSRFGVRATVGYNVDSFGHNGNMPQILRQSGLDSYVFMRPMPNEKQLPQDLFVWQGIDGSQVTTYRLPFSYNTELLHKDLFFKIADMPLEQGMAFFGIGNHGGGATIELLDWMKNNLDDRFVYSSPNRFFDEVKNQPLPIVADDLQFHAKGCYSACSDIKRYNRLAENALINTEKFSVISNVLADTPYPQSALTQGWQNVLFNQFHDTLGGCSIKQAYTDASYLFGEAMSIAERHTNFALSQISWNVDTMGGKQFVPYKQEGVARAGWCNAEDIGTPVVIFNPLAATVSTAIEVTDLPTLVTDEKGNEVPHQQIRASKTNCDTDKFATVFLATLPPMGYVTYRMFYDKSKAKEHVTPFKCTSNSIENDLLRLTFDEQSGELVSMMDKTTGNNRLCSPSQTLLVDETHCDTWAHGIEQFDNVTDVATNGSVKVIEQGPVRAVMRATQSVGNSVITRDYTLLANGNQVTVKTKIDFHEKHKMLKFRYPTSVTEGKAYCEIPFGFMQKPTDGKEHACGSWIALGNGSEGIAIANDSKHSFDATPNALTLTVLRGAIYADHYGVRDEFCPYMEQGEHYFEYLLAPFARLGQIKQCADQLNNKPHVIVETFHSGNLPTTFSAASVSQPNVVVTALKQWQGGNGIVVRCAEVENVDTTATLTVFGKNYTVQLPRNKVKTFVITEQGIEESNFVED